MLARKAFTPRAAAHETGERACENHERGSVTTITELRLRPPEFSGGQLHVPLLY